MTTSSTQTNRRRLTPARTGRPKRATVAIDAFAAVADPTRRRLIELLAEGDRPVFELADEFDMSRPAISKHLRLLKEAGVVSEHLAGRERLYQLCPESLEDVSAWTLKYHRFWQTRLRTLTTRHLKKS